MNRSYQILDSIQSFVSNSNENTHGSNDNLEEYKQDFYEMNIGSLKAIVSHAQAILDSINDPKIKENLTESWLQGKIAITEDYMRTIHDFVKYVPSDDDKSVAGCGCGGNKKKVDNTQPKVNETKTENVPQTPVQQNIHQAKPADK